MGSTATFGGTGRASMARSGLGAVGSGAIAGNGASCGVGGADDVSTSGRGTVASVIAVVGTGAVRSAVIVGGVGVTAICAAGVSGRASEAGGGMGAVPSACARRTGSGWKRGGTTVGFGVSTARSGGAGVGTGTFSSSGWGGGAFGWLSGRSATATTLGGGALSFTSGFTWGGCAAGTAMAGRGLAAEATAAAREPLEAGLRVRGVPVCLCDRRPRRRTAYRRYGRRRFVDEPHQQRVFFRLFGGWRQHLVRGTQDHSE